MSETLIISTVIIGVVVVVLLTGGIIYYTVAVTRRNTERMATFVKSIGLTLPPAGEIKTATHDGIDYAYQYRGASRNRPTEFHVWYPHDNRGHFVVRSERSGDRFFKRIGIVAEAQTSDRKFDDAYFIDTAEPAFARALFKRVAARDAVKSIMVCGFDNVTMDDHRILATVKQPRELSGRQRPIGDMLRALRELAQDQPKIPGHLGADKRASWKMRLQVVYITLAVLAAVGFGLFFLDLDRFKPVDAGQVMHDSLLLLVPTGALSLYLIATVLRGRSSSHTHLGISALISVIILPFLISGLLMFTNAYGDSNPTAIQRAQVISKRISHSKNGSTFRVRVASWRSGRMHEEFVVPRALYNRIDAERTHLAITTRAGRLGYEWLSAPIILAPESVSGK